MRIEACGTECDVTKLEDVKSLDDFAWKQVGQVHVIVNNAGAVPNMTSVMDATPEQIMSILNVNLMGAWNGVSVSPR